MRRNEDYYESFRDAEVELLSEKRMPYIHRTPPIPLACRTKPRLTTPLRQLVIGMLISGPAWFTMGMYVQRLLG